MVVDGFPQDQLVKYYDLYGERGFKLLLDKGGWYGNITVMPRLIRVSAMLRCCRARTPTNTEWSATIG